MATSANMRLTRLLASAFWSPHRLHYSVRSLRPWLGIRQIPRINVRSAQKIDSFVWPRSVLVLLDLEKFRADALALIACEPPAILCAEL